MYEYAARVKKIVDADTLDLAIDLGLGVWIDQRVRLWGINAPERFTTEGKAATAWLTEQLAPHDVITVRTLKDRQEKFGRYLALLFLPDDQISLNDELVVKGHAVEYMRDR